MTKRYKLNISIRKGMEDTPFETFEIDNQQFFEIFQLKKLSTFKDDAYFTVSIDEMPEPEIEEAE